MFLARQAVAVGDPVRREFRSPHLRAADCSERGTGAGRAGAGRRQERRPGRGPGRVRGAERAALMMERKSYPAGMRCLPSWLRTWGPLSSKASRSLTA